jgi:hypothetical protein
MTARCAVHHRIWFRCDECFPVHQGFHLEVQRHEWIDILLGGVMSPREVREREDVHEPAFNTKKTVCINCARPFTDPRGPRCWYGFQDVGPFCEACDDLIKVHTRFDAGGRR